MKRTPASGWYIILKSCSFVKTFILGGPSGNGFAEILLPCAGTGSILLCRRRNAPLEKLKAFTAKALGTRSEA